MSEIKRYTREDMSLTMEAVKNNLPLEITINDRDVDLIKVNSNGWISYRFVGNEDEKSMRVSELAKYLANENEYLVNYILKEKSKR